jgi:hypothetical protein
MAQGSSFCLEQGVWNLWFREGYRNFETKPPSLPSFGEVWVYFFGLYGRMMRGEKL